MNNLKSTSKCWNLKETKHNHIKHIKTPSHLAVAHPKKRREAIETTPRHRCLIPSCDLLQLPRVVQGPLDLLGPGHSVKLGASLAESEKSEIYTCSIVLIAFIAFEFDQNFLDVFHSDDVFWHEPFRLLSLHHLLPFRFESGAHDLLAFMRPACQQIRWSHEGQHFSKSLIQRKWFLHWALWDTCIYLSNL